MPTGQTDRRTDAGLLQYAFRYGRGQCDKSPSATAAGCDYNNDDNDDNVLAIEVKVNTMGFVVKKNKLTRRFIRHFWSHLHTCSQRNFPT